MVSSHQQKTVHLTIAHRHSPAQCPRFIRVRARGVVPPHGPGHGAGGGEGRDGRPFPIILQHQAHAAVLLLRIADKCGGICDKYVMLHIQLYHASGARDCSASAEGA